MKSDPPFVHFEGRVAVELGLSRDDVRALRSAHLTEKNHWCYKKRRVWLTEEGLDLLRQKMALPASVQTPGAAPALRQAQKTPLLLPAPFEGKLLAWMPTANSHILHAYKPGTDPKNRLNLVRVRVATNVNFTRGMELTARHVQADLYDLVGHCPRFKGKF